MRNDTDRLPIMEYGDQSDAQFLDRVARQHGPWDLIVDDGGHMMHQQITSFRSMFPHVTSGGMYFIEDLRTNFSAPYGGTPDGRGDTAAAFLGSLLIDLIGLRAPVPGLASISCCDEICMLSKA